MRRRRRGGVGGWDVRVRVKVGVGIRVWRAEEHLHVEMGRRVGTSGGGIHRRRRVGSGGGARIRVLRGDRGFGTVREGDS